MPSYHVVFTGHLDIWKLPPDGTLPMNIVQVYNIEAKDENKVQVFIDNMIGGILSCGGMKSYIDPHHIKASGINDSVTVPLHMITHFSSKVTVMTGEQPLIKDGKEAYHKSGKKVTIQ